MTADITTWGIQLVEGEPIKLNCCEDLGHSHHDYLAPFHLELLIRYQEVMQGEDLERKDHVKTSLETLQLIANETVIHEDTQFHCYDSPFKNTDYDEDQWTVKTVSFN